MCTRFVTNQIPEKKVDRQIQYAIRIFVYLRVVLGRDSDKPYTEGTQDINRIVNNNLL